jgi:hypothetical protein
LLFALHTSSIAKIAVKSEYPYVDPADPVANTYGKGRPNVYTQNILQRIDGRGDDQVDQLFTSSVGHSVESAALHFLGILATEEGWATRSYSQSGDGTIIEIPARTARSAEPSSEQLLEATKNDPSDVLALNHEFSWYLNHRVSFSDATSHNYGSLDKKGDWIDNP